MRLGGVARTLLAVVLLAAGIGGVLAFVSSRDSSTFDSARGPGRVFADQGHLQQRPGSRPAGLTYDSDPPTSGPHLPGLPARDARPLTSDELLSAVEVGDVVLLYGDRRFEAPLRRLADSVAGPYNRALAAAGQAVVLDFRPLRRGVTGVAWRHLQLAAGPNDPQLRGFIDFWLGRGATG